MPNPLRRNAIRKARTVVPQPLARAPPRTEVSPIINYDDLAAGVPSRPAGDLDDAQLLAKSRGSRHWNLTVTDVTRTADRMLRLTLHSADLRELDWQAGQDFTVKVAHVAGRDIRRRYTIAHADSQDISLDIYLHGSGVGTTWAQGLRAGDEVSAIGPRGKFVLNTSADCAIHIGDETSLPAICAMLRAANQPAQVLVEVDNPSDWLHFGLDKATSVKWTWLPRTHTLAVDQIGRRTDCTEHYYVSGEASRVQVWRAELESLGAAPEQISAKAHWGTGRSNASHGEPLSPSGPEG
jgi:NADPH-dependent ferric siderophore reductase